MDRSGRVTPDERKQALDEIAAEVAVCTRCPLHAQRTRAVPGEGHPDTEVVFVGEGPGYNEDKEGRPFVGAAGGILNELLKAIGWRREEVFITNVVKCRPPGNRDPEPNEIAACAPYLKRQLEVLDPALIVTLGRYSLGTFMPGARISSAHGTIRPTDPDTGATNASTYALYHPAAALRQGSLKETMFVDMAGVPDALIQSRERRAQATPEAKRPAIEATTESMTVPVTEPIIPAPPAELPMETTELDEVLEAATVAVSAHAEPQLELFR
jgi:uracil-DNA glycosylase